MASLSFPSLSDKKLNAPFPLSPVPEGEADESTRLLFDEIKRTLQVDFVPLMFRSFAEPPAFLRLVWSRTASALSRPGFEEDAAELARWAVEGMRRSYFIGDHRAALERAGLSDDCEPIRSTAGEMSRMDARLLLAVAPLMPPPAPGEATVALFRPSSPPSSAGESPHPSVRLTFDSGPTPPILESIQATLALSEPPDEYRALSPWPDYLDYAWKRQEPLLRGSRFRELKALLHDRAALLAEDSPGAGGIGLRELKAAGLSDPQSERAIQLLHGFAYLLAATTLLMAAFRVGLGED